MAELTDPVTVFAQSGGFLAPVDIFSQMVHVAALQLVPQGVGHPTTAHEAVEREFISAPGSFDAVFMTNSEIHINQSTLPGFALQKTSRVLTLFNNARLAVPAITG